LEFDLGPDQLAAHDEAGSDAQGGRTPDEPGGFLTFQIREMGAELPPCPRRRRGGRVTRSLSP